MNIIYLKSAFDDLKWFFYYYENVFVAGREKAQKKFYSTEALIIQNPYIGHPTQKEEVREFSIPQIPFSFIYRIVEDRIEVLRVWDERQDRMNLDTK